MAANVTDRLFSIISESLDDFTDINLTVGKPIQIESSGKLNSVKLFPDFGILTPYQTEQIALSLINNNGRLLRELLTTGACDLSYSLKGRARFRVNIFSQSGCYSIILRKLETKIPTINDLKLPEAFPKISRELSGLIFVTGATGNGKSTSLAAILEEINNNDSIHIVTLEDPIEFRHVHKKATFNQRELGTDFRSFSEGLKAALRQSPKVIMVGEMRDRESVEIVLSAAETGHLVLTTLHTGSASQTINRLLGMFSAHEEKQLRMRLAECIKWIVCQKLIPSTSGRRVAAFEILGTSLRVKDIILNGESEGKTFLNVMQNGQHYGMRTLDESLISLYRSSIISEETAAAYSTEKAIVRRGIDSLKSIRGEETSDIQKLEMDLSV